MKTIKQFSIPFGGLRIGKHNFEFKITDEFFANFDYSLIKSGTINLSLEFDKQQEAMFILNFLLQGHVNLTCERCLDLYQYGINAEERLVVKLGEESYDDPEILVISRNEHSIDISPLVYEFISLALPLIHQHSLDESGEPMCNNETAKVLKALENAQQELGERKEKNDPRWDILNKLKNN